MAGKITGITIDIAGNTSPLVSSLKSADSALKTTNDALKSVNQALKLPGASQNVELLTSKSNLLAEAIDANSDRLDVLKATAEEAMKTLGEEGGTTQAQMAQLQAEIAKTEETLAGLESEADETNAALDGLGSDAAGELDDVAGAANDAAGALDSVEGSGTNVESQLGNIASKAQEVGEALNTYVTEPLMKLGKASIEAFDEVDGGMDTVIKKTGATGEQLEDLETVYKNVFGSMPVSADEAGEAVGEIATRFGYTGAQLEETSKAFLRFSNITGTDVSGAVASVDKIMLKFGMDASQSSQVMDLLASASQSSGISVDTLTSTLESNGAQLKEMGFDLTESVNLLAQFEASGVDAGTAMAAFKKEVMNSTKAGADAETELRSRIDAIKQATTDTEALQIATEIFGGKAAPEMTQAIREGRLSIEDLSTSLSDYEGTVTETFENTQDPPDKAKVAFNNLKLAGADLGGSIMEVLTPAIEKVSDVIQKLKDWFDKLDPSTKKIIVTVGILAVTIGPLLLVIAQVITAVQTIMTVLPAVKGAILAVNAAMAANPILLVVTLLAGLVAAFVLLWNNCEEFREFWIYLWENIQQGAQIVFDWLEQGFEAVGQVFSSVGEGLSSLFSDIGSAFSSVGETISTVCSDIGGFFQDMADTVGGIWNGLWEVVKGVINTMIGGINGMISGVESGVNAVIGALNTLHWEIPDWVPGLGGMGFGFDISKVSFGRVPELATGAVIPPNSPFLAVLGDQPQGVNVEAPLSTIKDALLQAIDARGGSVESGPIYVTAYFGNENFGTVVAKANSRNAYLSGGY